MAIEYLDKVSPRRTSRIEYLDDVSPSPPVLNKPGLLQLLGQAYQNLEVRPSAALRGGIQGGLSGYLRGAVSPETVPTFQDQALNAYYGNVARQNAGQPANFAQRVGGLVPSAAGLAVDVVTSPANALLTLLGMTPQAKQLGDVVAGSRPGQALGRFLTKERSLPRLPEFQLGRVGTIARPNVAREQLLADIREGFLQAPKLAGEEFGTQLDELATKFPNQRVNLRPALERARQLATQNPAVGNLIERSSLNSKESGFVQSLLNQPEVAENLTLKESQTVKRVFQQILKAKFGQTAPELFDAHLDTLDVWHSIREAQLSAFPEFQDVLGGYRSVLDNFRSAKPSLSKGGLEKSLLENFGGTERARAVRELLPQETIDLIKRLQSSTSFRKWAVRLGIAGTIGAGATVGGTVAKGLLKPTIDYTVGQ